MNGRPPSPPKLPMRQILAVDLKTLKPAVLEAAQTAGSTPSEWARHTIAKALAVEPSSMRTMPKPEEGATTKLTLRLTPQDSHALQHWAETEGITRTEWLRQRIRHPLAPSMSKAQIDALVQANYQIAGVGRNLNQVARALNAQPGMMSSSDRAAIQAAVQAVREHLSLAAQAMADLPQTGRVRKAGRHAAP